MPAQTATTDYSRPAFTEWAVGSQPDSPQVERPANAEITYDLVAAVVFTYDLDGQAMEATSVGI